MFLFTNKEKPYSRTTDWPQVPIIAYDAKDYKGTDQAILKNAINEDCNRAAWKYQPSPSLQSYIAALKADDSHEAYYRDIFADYESDYALHASFAFKNIHNTQTHTIKLVNDQEIKIILTKQLLIPGVENLLDHLRTMGNSIIETFDGKFEFVNFYVRSVSLAEAEAKRLRASGTPSFHIDAAPANTQGIVQQITTIDNLLGPETLGITPKAYPTVLEYARGRQFHGSIDPFIENKYKLTARQLRTKIDPKIDLAAWAAIHANRESGHDHRSIFEKYEHNQINIFSRGYKSERLLASPALVSRILHIHGEPDSVSEPQASKRLTVVTNGNVLEKRTNFYYPSL